MAKCGGKKKQTAPTTKKGGKKKEVNANGYKND